jgi:hypothetical protein
VTEFAETALRHMCRNPRCRSKLAAPVSNPREAFCARGCHTSFYLHRCLVCEGQIEQPKSGVRLLCKKAKCRNAWKAKTGFGRYAPTIGESAARSAHSIGIKSRGKFTVDDAIKYSIGLRAPKRVLDVELAHFRFIDLSQLNSEAA